MKFSSGNVEVSGITFSRGNTDGDGGALYIDGKNNKIYQCYFAGNSAPVGRGGAIYFDSGEIKETDGSANTAAQCNDIYLATAGSCGLWDPANY